MLASLLPTPKHTYQAHAEDVENEDDGVMNVAQAPAPKPHRIIPPYPNRHALNFVPTDPSDFEDGGAFPEIHVVQYPLQMGQPGVKSTAVIAVNVDETGQVRYDALVKQGANKNKLVQTSLDDIKEKVASKEAISLPDEKEEQEAVDKTRQALEALLESKIRSAKPTTVVQRSETEEPTYIRYTPNPNAPGFSAEAKQRVIRMVEAQVDPMEPPKHKHKKVPKGPGSPPVPVLHSPPRKLTVADQQAWKVPPCISNWKNARGYTIPLDKRLAADGRGLQEITINNKFATLSEALYISERKAAEDLRTRNQLRKSMAIKEKEDKEQQLREMALKSRMERAGVPLEEIQARMSEGISNDDDVDEFLARRDVDVIDKPLSARNNTQPNDSHAGGSRRPVDNRPAWMTQEEERRRSEGGGNSRHSDDEWESRDAGSRSHGRSRSSSGGSSRSDRSSPRSRSSSRDSTQSNRGRSRSDSDDSKRRSSRTRSRSNDRRSRSSSDDSRSRRRQADNRRTSDRRDSRDRGRDKRDSYSRRSPEGNRSYRRDSSPDRYRERERDRDGNRSARDRDQDRSRDRERENDRERERDRNREPERRDRDRDRDRDRERNRSPDRDREKAKARDRRRSPSRSEEDDRSKGKGNIVAISDLLGAAGDEDEEDIGDSSMSKQQREKIRLERRKERERQLRLENMKGNFRKSKLDRDASRDVSEKIALGMHRGGGQLAGEALFDSRLFNQSAGLDAGFGGEDEYNTYSKPLFARGEAASVYRPKRDDSEVYGDAEAQLAKLKDTSRFRPDKGFKGAEGGAGGLARDAPVQFERAREREEDPFEIDDIVQAKAKRQRRDSDDE